jgi:phosphoglycerol geranylgeranyltransferase
MGSLYSQLTEDSERGKKSFAVLIDPDKLDDKSLNTLMDLSETCTIDYFFLGGSLLSKYDIPEIIQKIKRRSNVPIILFPGGYLQVEPTADAILLLSLISGRNADYLIGQHVIAAPLIKQSKLEVLSTGYLLVDCGKQTTASYISNTTPLPYDKPSIAAATAMAGEMLGLKCMYLDGGSGAAKPVSPEMIAVVKKSITCPLIVGGGINSEEKVLAAMHAGADIIVVGTGIEKNPELMVKLSRVVHATNLIPTKQ